MLRFFSFVSLAPFASTSIPGTTCDDLDAAIFRWNADFDGCQPSFPDPMVPFCWLSFSDALGTAQTSDFDSSLELTWIHQLKSKLQAIVDACAFRAALLLHALWMEIGNCLIAMCRAGCMLTLCYLCRLLFFGWRLKGGTCNCDNILLAARSASAAVPWHLGIGLRSFSPRLQGQQKVLLLLS